MPDRLQATGNRLSRKQMACCYFCFLFVVCSSSFEFETWGSVGHEKNAVITFVAVCFLV
jgi:hypothetical protein